MEIIYQDSGVVVCIKPSGYVSQKSNSNEKSVADELELLCESEIYPVHRLDKNVSGVMVFAKTSKAAAELSKQITQGSFVKEYYALVHGKLEEKSGIFEDLLFKDSSKNKTFVVKKERKGVKKAKLSYQVICESEIENEAVSVVKVKLYTGRTHQIRVQFASRKHSLIGDRRYGGKDFSKKTELFSCHLGFKNPITKKQMDFTAMPDSEYLMHNLLK